MFKEINPSLITFSRKFQSLCKKRYRGRPKGCPNYGKKPVCPPGKPLIDKVLNFDREIYVIYTRFFMGEKAEERRQNHPDWTIRQCYNPLYWQGKARKIHHEEEGIVMAEFDLTKLVWPEPHGVNVTDLMSKIGIELKWGWPPEHVLEGKKYLENSSYIVTLAGHSC